MARRRIQPAVANTDMYMWSSVKMLAEHRQPVKVLRLLVRDRGDVRLQPGEDSSAIVTLSRKRR